ncbi:hypothetical protein Fmac_020360 [Flemingia macrophylla]|uniref:Uncharacterized protein n=1 Tax=Flemingia macrophylla TaxID=520843 RepID=A0ABD1LTW0_9FABA
MDSAIVRSFPNAFSLTTGGNLWKSKQYSTKKIFNANCYASKVLEHKGRNQIGHGFWRLEQPTTLNHHYKCIGGRSTYHGCNRKYDVKATPRPPFDAGTNASDAKSILDYVKIFLITIHKLTIPVAAIARLSSMISASLLAVENLSDLSPLFLTGVLQIVVAYMFMEFYINGVNQLCDIEIDKINKPYLPFASGEISFRNGVIVVASCLTLSACFGLIIGSWPLIWCLLLSFLVWTGYSVNTSVFKRPATIPRSLICTIVFVTIYFVSLALFKDIPDIEGDKAHGINSLPARMGIKRAFWISISIFETAFGVALLAGATSSSSLWIKIASGLGHSILASILWYKATFVDLKSKASIASFYRFLWKIIGVKFHGVMKEI